MAMATVEVLQSSHKSHSAVKRWPWSFPFLTVTKNPARRYVRERRAVVYSREERAWLWPGSQVRAIRLRVCIQEGERDTLTHAHVCAHTERDRDKERSERDRDR